MKLVEQFTLQTARLFLLACDFAPPPWFPASTAVTHLSHAPAICLLAARCCGLRQATTDELARADRQRKVGQNPAFFVGGQGPGSRPAFKRALQHGAFAAFGLLRLRFAASEMLRRTCDRNAARLLRIALDQFAHMGVAGVGAFAAHDGDDQAFAIAIV